MAGSDFARDISFVPEVTFGTTPTTPAMKFLRFSGGFPSLEKNTFASEEIRSDGQVTDLRHGTRRVGGDLNFELSYGAYDDWLQAALGGTWATDVLKAGRTPRYFSIEERHTDISQFAVTTGVSVNSLSLNIQPDAMVTGSIGIVGRNQIFNAVTLGTPTAVASHPPFSGFTGAITEGGSAIGIMTALELSLTRNIEPVYVVGPSDLAKEYVMGQNVVTGTATFLLENKAQIEKFTAETESAIEVTLEGVAGGDLTITLPRIKYTGATRQRGTGASLVVSMPFQALLDPTTNTNLMLTRIAA